MSTLITWVKRNKFATFLLIVVVLLVAGQLRQSPGQPYYPAFKRSATMSPGVAEMAMDSVGYGGAVSLGVMGSPIGLEAPPAPDVTERMIVSDSYLSLVVNDVAAAVDEVKNYAQSIGGYFVDSSVDRPEEGGMGTVTLRIPADNLDEALNHLKGQAVTVVSENLTGRDVTDQYVDNDERLRILEGNKARFEEIMQRATEIDDIVRVQREIFSLQSQIDAIKGSQRYLEQTSEMAKITVFLSTDELALPYAPTDSWRPEVIFKTAVRSLVSTMRDFGSAVIWIGVYAAIWLPVLIIGFLLYRYFARRGN